MENKLSRLIDQEIRRIANEVYEKREAEKQAFFQFKSDVLPTVINSRFGFNRSTLQFHNFHKSLLNRGCFVCSLEGFRPHFNDENLYASKPIVWLKETTKLASLFKDLWYEKDVPSADDPWLLLSQHFVDRYGNKYDTHVLRNSISLSKGTLSFINSVRRDMMKTT